MPKRARRAHIPQQAVRKRKGPARPPVSPVPVREEDDDAPTFADEPALAMMPGYGTGVVAPRTRRRTEMLTAERDHISGRVIPGQLPTFERSYLVTELRRISIISASLLALLLVLTLALR